MKRYSEWSPSAHDCRGLNLPDKQEWLVVEAIGHNRDSDALARSNWETALKWLRVSPKDRGHFGRNLGNIEAISEEDYFVARFGHWACGWFEILLVRPGSAAAEIAEKIERAIESYPILDEDHHSEVERDEADETWKNCYNDAKRIEYIRQHRSQFEFCSFSEMLSCVRGEFFAGYASELIGQ